MIARTNHTIACFRPNMRCHIVLILLIVFAPLCGCLTDSSEFSPTTDLEDYPDPEYNDPKYGGQNTVTG